MSPRRPPPPHAQAHLPSLDGDCALIVVNILQRISNAIWQAHGPAMNAVLEQAYEKAHSTTGPAPCSTTKSAVPKPPDDDLPF